MMSEVGWMMWFLLYAYIAQHPVPPWWNSPRHSSVRCMMFDVWWKMCFTLNVASYRGLSRDGRGQVTDIRIRYSLTPFLSFYNFWISPLPTPVSRSNCRWEAPLSLSCLRVLRFISDGRGQVTDITQLSTKQSPPEKDWLVIYRARCNSTWIL